MNPSDFYVDPIFLFERENKKKKQKRCPDYSEHLFLLGYSDSNQEKQDQNLLCYHYTIAQNQRTIVIFLF